MSDINQKIIDMIMNGASANEICDNTGLSNKQLFYRLNMLKAKGYNFSKKFYYTGDIVYGIDNSLYNKEENGIALLTSPSDKEFKALLISDLHFGNKYCRVDLLNQVYDFCIKEGINIIINAGDLIDGYIGADDVRNLKTSEEQIEFALKKYPFDKNILNFIVLGNHDYSALTTSGQNLETVLEAKRHDIVSLGYGYGSLKIKNDQIIIKHPSTPGKDSIKINVSSGLLILGHTHRSKNLVNNNLVSIYLSALCNMASNRLPGFVKVRIKLNNGIFVSGTFEQFTLFDKFYKVNECCYDLSHNRSLQTESIDNEEDRIPYKDKIEKEEEKQEITKTKQLSQIEKFNNRYKK